MRRLPTTIMLLLLLLGGACAPRLPAPPQAPPSGIAPPLRDPHEACVRGLLDAGLVFETVPPFGAGNGCEVENPVRVVAAALAWNQPGVVTCAMAAALHRFETEVVRPAARRHLGRDVRKVRHFGTYACRNEAGGRSRRSQHAVGRAIDVAAFELADGEVVEVARHWQGAGARSAFLTEVARQACGVFNVVLSPKHDAAHRDHLHLDIGPWRLCD